ncbi:hypothetical protein ACFSW8_13345 [Rubritalea tangerina]|uniref:Uncharacterized protein n=2 Tax=Rubritalea tangerina TaxID=430798 RepID=A0ABW4ZDK3_9BACT
MMMIREILLVGLALSLSAWADELIFDGSGKINSRGVYEKSLEVGGEKLVMQVRAGSSFAHVDAVRVTQTERKRGGTFVLGVAGGHGQKKEMTVDTRYEDGQIVEEEWMEISFSEPVVLSGWEFGNLGAQRYVEFSVSGEVENSAIGVSAGVFEKVLELEAGEVLVLKARNGHRDKSSGVSLRSITVSLLGGGEDRVKKAQVEVSKRVEGKVSKAALISIGGIAVLMRP